jgi:hypothetical protein
MLKEIYSNLQIVQSDEIWIFEEQPIDRATGVRGIFQLTKAHKS